MFARLMSVGIVGIESYMIEIEADVSGGLPNFDIVGLPDAAVKESRDRVRAAIKNCGFKFPVGRITVNLAPADKRKEGAIYDLPILLAILAASEQLKLPKGDCAFLGEVSLDGQIRPVNGVLAMTIAAMQNGIKEIYVPQANSTEGAVVDGINVYGVSNVKSLIDHLTGSFDILPTVYSAPADTDNILELDFSEVKGQSAAKKALEVAAAGGHNILIIGHIYLLSKNEPRCAKNRPESFLSDLAVSFHTQTIQPLKTSQKAKTEHHCSVSFYI